MFYERFLQLCQGANISPSAAATKAGFNRGTVSVWKKKFEAGQDVVPEQEIVNKICAFFGCTEPWLRGISTQKEKSPTPEGERPISDDDIKTAFFNGIDPSVPQEERDAMWEDAKDYFYFKIQKRRDEQNNGK